MKELIESIRAEANRIEAADDCGEGAVSEAITTAALNLRIIANKLEALSFRTWDKSARVEHARGEVATCWANDITGKINLEISSIDLLDDLCEAVERHIKGETL